MSEVPRTIDEAARALRAGTVTSVELTEAAIARADDLDGSLGAYLHRTDDTALVAARTADDELGRGVDRGPLHGIPLCVKDIFATNDAPTTAQSLVLDPSWGDRGDAAVVAALREGGAVLTGKVTTMEFAIGMPDPEKPFPIPRNPWSPERWSGGSSSGTAIAIATGMAFGGPGTDTGGSIRIPSAYCGTTGLKPTYGRVSTDGCFPLGASLDHVGPMARTALDCALLFDAMTGDATVRDIERGISGLRVGVDREHHRAAPEVESLVDDAIVALEKAGATVREVSLPSYDLVTAASATTMFAETYVQHRERATERWSDYFRATRQVIALGSMVSTESYVRAQRVREIGRRQLRRLLAEVDVIACLTAGSGAPPVDDANLLGLMTLPVFASYWNGTGFPSMSVPIGFDGDGLPIGLQLAGTAGADALVLRAGHAFQQVTDWHRREPGQLASRSR